MPAADNNNDIDPNTLERDDSVIATALKWSLVVVLLIAIGGGAAYWLSRKPPVVVVVPPPPPPPPPPPAKMETPEIRFTDITAEAGIKFVHENGAYGDKLLPETMGSGCAFFDFDNDGDQDILFVNSCRWPWDSRELGKDRPPPTQALRPLAVKALTCIARCPTCRPTSTGLSKVRGCVTAS